MLLSEDQEYYVHLGDCIEHLYRMPPWSVDFAVYSPPFPSVYSYSSMREDIGNSENLKGDAPLHLSWFFRQMIRVMKPGRVMVVHATQIMRQKRSGGGEGMYDFRGLLIRLAERSGFIYDYDWVLRRNPQAQAIRSRSRSLQFAGLESNRVQSRGAMGDYLIKFKAPGDCEVEVDSEGQVTRNEWIDWAECFWRVASETDTLNVKEGRSEDDVKHICPMSLPVIDRLIRLYSNPGELVFSPFCGIGSELYSAIKLDRRAYGCELKPLYYQTALKNIDRAIEERRQNQVMLWDRIPETQETAG